MESRKIKTTERIYKNMPFMMFISLLVVLYIANIHKAERKLRYVNVLKNDVKEAKWKYQDVRQSIMYGSTQGQLLKKLQGGELKENRSIPEKIIIESKS